MFVFFRFFFCGFGVLRCSACRVFSCIRGRGVRFSCSRHACAALCLHPSLSLSLSLPLALAHPLDGGRLGMPVSLLSTPALATPPFLLPPLLANAHARLISPTFHAHCLVREQSADRDEGEKYLRCLLPVQCLCVLCRCVGLLSLLTPFSELQGHMRTHLCGTATSNWSCRTG